MSRSLFIVSLLACFLGASGAGQAAEVKIKYVTTAYADAEGIGLSLPEGVACGATGVWVADTGNSRLLRYARENGKLRADTVIPLAKSSPLVVQTDPQGMVYALDGRERRIVKLSPTGEHRGYVAPKGLPGGADAVVRSFRIDGKGSLYLLDVLGERVLVLGPDERLERQISFPAEYGFFSDLAVDRQGTVFLVDSLRAVVHAAPPGAESFSPLSPSLEEYMNFPTAIAVDRNGTIFLSDQFGSGLALVARDGSFLGRKLGMGWGEGLLHYPAQICIGEQGDLLIADRNNNRVQMFSLVQE